jgi:hypothetical protein
MLVETKVIVTVSEMARMVGLSRARFYQLQRLGVFPPPVYDVATRRPIYVEELQKVCLEVRRRNCGINGKPVLFYARHNLWSPVTKGPPKAKKPPKDNRHAHLVDALKSLGLVSVTAAQVEATVKELFPQGIAETDQAEVIRTVFVHLKRRNSGDNVGR